MNRKAILAAVWVVVLGLSAPSPAWAAPHTFEELGRGGLVWDQQPLNTGGPGADTDFYSNSGQRVWQQVADDILLPSAATIRRIAWWGFYGGNFGGGTTLPPTGPETMRLRFYDARPGDGLPGQTLYEESFLNPSRTETGRIVWANGGAEYIFEVDLTTPFVLDAAVPYWLEVVQVGDVDSTFRWEYSPGTGTPFAFKHSFIPDWQRTTLVSNVALQLSTVPEPATLGLFVFGFMLVARRKRRREVPVLAAVLAGVLALSVPGPAWAAPHTFEELGRGGLVWDQQPLNTGGPGADTDFYTDTGERFWMRVADDILLPSAATIRRIVWWGFYGGNFTGNPLPPTGPETMRLRFYDARPGDGLPGQTLWEESFLNPSRTATGRVVLTPVHQPEYIFEVDLTTPFTLHAAIPYWLEIVQVGDVDSHYRWEYSSGTGTPYARKNLWVPYWQRTTLTANVAFQLSTVPEPATLGLLVFGFMLVTRRKRRREVPVLAAVLAGVLALSVPGPAWADSLTMEDLGRDGGLVWDQQPLNTGGPGADTDFISDGGQRVWQQVADDILLPSAATIRRIVWWGFYGGNFGGGTTLPPTGPETMRLRFYDARPGDGLPGQTLYEESFLNPSRTETGRIVWANGGAEYIFEVDLTTPFVLDAAVPYWLEVVQVGDVDSHYRWEVSPGTGTPFAFINPFVPDWRRTTGTANVAFQLSTVPEPATLGLFVFGFMLVTRRKSRRKEV